MTAITCLMRRLTVATALRVRTIPLILLLGCVVNNYEDPAGPRFAGAFSSTSTQSSASLRVVIFNIEFSLKHEDAADDLLADPNTVDADVVLLQEMDPIGTEFIANALSLDYVFYPSSVSDVGLDFGNAVLSRWPIISDRKVTLPHQNPTNGRGRASVVATLQTPEGPLVVQSVHTDTVWLGPAGRIDQARAVLESIDEEAQRVVIGGDFNTIDPGSLDETTEIFLDAGYTWATKGVEDTSRNFTIDLIFSKGYSTQATGKGLSDASDHLPVWALFDEN